MNEAPEARWLTYRELADESGLSLPAAMARARRMVKAGKWRHRLDNDPPNAARVLVTTTDLEAMRGVAEGGAQRVPQPPPEPFAINVLAEELKASRQAVGALQEALAREREGADRLRTERDAALKRAADAEQQREEARVRAAAAEGELRGRRWWKWWA